MTEKPLNKFLTFLAIKEPVRIATINKKELEKGDLMATTTTKKNIVVFIKFHPHISEIYPYLFLTSANGKLI